MSHISENIKKFRTAKGLPQKMIADKLGITQSAYQKIESGDTSIKLDKLQLIADALEVSFLELLATDDKFVYNNFSNTHKGGNGILVQHISAEREHYEKIIASKDETILAKDNEIATLKRVIENFIPKANPKKN